MFYVRVTIEGDEVPLSLRRGHKLRYVHLHDLDQVQTFSTRQKARIKIKELRRIGTYVKRKVEIITMTPALEEELVFLRLKHS